MNVFFALVTIWPAAAIVDAAHPAIGFNVYLRIKLSERAHGAYRIVVSPTILDKLPIGQIDAGAPES